MKNLNNIFSKKVIDIAHRSFLRFDDYFKMRFKLGKLVYSVHFIIKNYERYKQSFKRKS